MPSFDNNGASIHYELVGSGPPLLLIPGLGSDGASWGQLTSQLAERFRLIVINNRGSGQTRCDGPITVSDMIGDCLALLDRLGFAKADIVGHSMGGMIALRIAAGYPGRVNRLVTVTASLALSGKQVLLYDELARLRYDLPAERWFALLYQWLLSDAFFKDPAKVAAAAEASALYPYRQSPEDFARQVTAMKAIEPVDPTSIRCRVLVLAAALDILIPPAVVASSHQLIPTHRFEIIPTAAHSVTLEAPEAVAKAISEFLK